LASNEPFDRIGAAYDREVAEALGPFSGEHAHFLEVKARWLVRLARSRLGTTEALRALDLGCGLGLLERHLTELGTPVFGADVALSPLAAGRRAELRSVLYSSSLPFASGAFDLVFMASVLHHVRPELRPSLLREVRRVVRPGGLAVIFEHNPWHPGTRWIVSRCEFDRDAVLVGPGTLRRTVRKAGLRPVLRRHLLVTPWSGRLFDAVDRALGRLPLGAQYLLATMPEPEGADDPGGPDAG
jgi:SAM-dependent methyltransferase